MEFRVLGALEVVHGGKSVPLGGRRQRSLLAILLLRANKVISSDALIDELWGERPPDSAQHTLHAYVSRLRKLLREDGSGEHVLVSYPAGYMLRVGFEELDLDRFEHLADDGRRALSSGAAGDAAAKCRAALSLWQGPALADLRFESFARVDVERLEERRVGVLEDRIDADLKLGEHAALVAELESLVAEHPPRERLRQQLMLALYRSGRQAEALEAYRSARSYLVDECGLEPGKQLQTLQQAILNQDAALDLDRTAHAHILTTVLPAKSEHKEPSRNGRGGSDLPAENGAPALNNGLTQKRRKAVIGVAMLAVAAVAGALLVSERGGGRALAPSAARANAVVFVDPARRTDRAGRYGWTSGRDRRRVRSPLGD